MKTPKANVLLPIIAILIAALVALAGAGASIADDGGCPNENSTNGEGNSSDNSAHGDDKQDDRDCEDGGTGSDPTPTGAAEATPSPTPSPTAPPTSEPIATPTPSPSPEPPSTPTAEPTATPTPEPTSAPPTDVPTPTPIPTPPPGADVQVVEVIVNAPASAGAGVQFVLTGGANIRNNGPVTPAIVDTTFSPALPPGCTATTGAVTVQNTTLPVNVNVFVSRSWTVRCFEPGFYSFTINVDIAIDPGQAIADPDPTNNLMSGSDTTTVS